MPSYLKFILKLLLIIPILISILLTIPIIIISYFISFFNSKISNSIATLSALLFWTTIEWTFKLTFDIEIVSSSSNINNTSNTSNTSNISNDVIPEGDYLVISNHISAADFILINSINKHRFQHSKYAFKRTLRFVPIFYQGFIACKYLVLKRCFEKDKESIINHFKDIKKNKYPMWFILFSEGHRFTDKFKNESDQFCIQKGIKPFKNVLMPRHKGFSLICNELRDSYVKNVLDLTFYCDKKGFSIFTVLFGLESYKIKCDVRIIKIDDIKETEKFLMESFRRKDSLIEEWIKGSKLE